MTSVIISRDDDLGVPITVGIPVPISAGENNTASNVGTGIGVFKQKTLVDLEFKSVASADGTIAVVDDVGNDNVDLASLATLENARTQGDTFAGDVNMGSNKLVSVADPTAVQDAATKNYVDSQIGAAWVEDEFTPTAAQVTFILSQAPADTDAVTVRVNGVLYDDTTDWTVSGTTVTWLNNLFVLATTDKLIVRYV